MYSIYGYFYNEKENIILSSGSKRDCSEFLEAWIIDYIGNVQGNKITNFSDLIKPVDYVLTSQEWNKNIRLWVTKTNNRSKLTIKMMEKDRGYLFNSTKIKKLASIYLVQNSSKFEYAERRVNEHFIWDEEFDEVLKVIGQPDK